MAKIGSRRKVGGIINANQEWFGYDHPKQEAKAKEHKRAVLKSMQICGVLCVTEAFGDKRFALSPLLEISEDGEDLEVLDKGETLLPDHAGLKNRLEDVQEGEIVLISVTEMYVTKSGPFKGSDGYGYDTEVLTVEGEALPF